MPLRHYVFTYLSHIVWCCHKGRLRDPCTSHWITASEANRLILHCSLKAAPFFVDEFSICYWVQSRMTWFLVGARQLGDLVHDDLQSLCYLTPPCHSGCTEERMTTPDSVNWTLCLDRAAFLEDFKSKIIFGVAFSNVIQYLSKVYLILWLNRSCCTVYFFSFLFCLVVRWTGSSVLCD